MPEVSAAAAQLLREALAVEVDLHWVTLANAYGDVSGSHLIFDAWIADLPDPDNYLRQANALRILRRAGWQDPELDAWLARAAHTPDRAVRMALYRQADRRLVVEQALLVPLVYGGLKELAQPWVGGARPNKLGYWGLKDVVVEKHASA